MEKPHNHGDTPHFSPWTRSLFWSQLPLHTDFCLWGFPLWLLPGCKVGF